MDKLTLSYAFLDAGLFLTPLFQSVLGQFFHLIPTNLLTILSVSITGQSRTYNTLSVSRLSTRSPSAGTAPATVY